jgi:hypothetical protein
MLSRFITAILSLSATALAGLRQNAAICGNNTSWNSSRGCRPSAESNPNRIFFMIIHQPIFRAIFGCWVTFSSVGHSNPKLDLQIDSATGKPRLSFYATLGGNYKLRQSPDLITWNDLTPLTPGMNRKIELLDSLASSPSFYRIEFTPPYLLDSDPLLTFCAIGDSITDRNTFTQPSNYNALGYDQSGWGAILEQLSGGRIRSTSRSNAFKTDRDHGYSGITSWMFLGGGGWLPTGLVPIEDAISTNADCFIVHIGTNDIASSTPSEVVTRIQGIWTRLVQTGKPVIGTDILQRSATYPGWTEVFRDRVDEVNATLRSSWQSFGLASYRPWDHLIEKDPQGFAIPAEFPNDGVHPTMRVGLKLGKDLHQILKPFYNGAADQIPDSSSNRWLTPNPSISGATDLATSWIPMSLGVSGTDVIYSKVSDLFGDWQRIEIINPQPQGTRGLYSRQVGAGNTWNVGDRCVATMQVRVPAGTSLSGVGINVQCAGATNPWIDVAGVVNTYIPSPIEDFEATIVSNPFTIPVGTTQLWFLVRITGESGTVDFRQAGIYRIDPE